MVEDQVESKLQSLSIKSSNALLGAGELTRNNCMQAIVIEEHSLDSRLRTSRDMVESFGKEEKFSFLGYCNSISVGALIAGFTSDIKSKEFLKPESQSVLAIKSISVLPSFRKIGVARQMITVFLEALKDSTKVDTILIDFPSVDAFPVVNKLKQIVQEQVGLFEKGNDLIKSVRVEKSANDSQWVIKIERL